MAETQTRAHRLMREGAPYDDGGNERGGGDLGVRGPGRALCTCGELSNILPSAAARKRWHKDHKAKHA